MSNNNTIKISPLPNNTTQATIREALNCVVVNRIMIKTNLAYVELENEDAVEVLEFTFPEASIEGLDGAKYIVETGFKWGESSDESSEIQDLNDDKEAKDEATNLTQPAPQNLFTISNCDIEILAGLTQKQMRTTIFGAFTSIHRILKKDNKVIVELQDQYEAQRFEAVFPQLKVTPLGVGAFVDLEAGYEINFASLWIVQHQLETSGKSQTQKSKVLHEEMIPKLNKQTSMQTNFLNSQQSSNSKTNSGFQVINEQEGENAHTKTSLPEVGSDFLLDERGQTVEIMIGGDQHGEEEKKKAEEEKRIAEEKAKLEKERKEKEEAEKIRKLEELKKEEEMKKQEEERKRQQEERKKHEEEQQRKKQEEQRKKKEEEEKKKHEEEARKKHEQQERKKHEEQERIRHQQQQKRIKEEQEATRKEAQLKAQLEKERKEKEQKEQELKVQQELEEKRLKQVADKQQREKQAELVRIQKEKQEKLLEEEKKRQELEKKKASGEKPQDETFLLPTETETKTEDIKKFVENVSPQRVPQLISKSNERAPVVFWGLVLLTVFTLVILGGKF